MLSALGMGKSWADVDVNPAGTGDGHPEYVRRIRTGYGKTRRELGRLGLALRAMNADRVLGVTEECVGTGTGWLIRGSDTFQTSVMPDAQSISQ